MSWRDEIQSEVTSLCSEDRYTHLICRQQMPIQAEEIPCSLFVMKTQQNVNAWEEGNCRHFTFEFMEIKSMIKTGQTFTLYIYINFGFNLMVFNDLK